MYPSKPSKVCRLVLGLIVVLLTFASPAKDDAGVVYRNATIWTGDESMPLAAELWVVGDRIKAVGENLTVSESTTEVDLQGAFVIPGMIDNHTHFIEGGAGLASVQLRDANSKPEFIKRIADFANTLNEGEWLRFGNWDHELWGGELPHKSWIDPVTQKNPVFVMRIDGHMGFANSVALRLAGITRASVAPEGGVIERDENGEPTGVLKDTAMDAVFKVIGQPSPDEALRAIKAAQAHAFSLGLTQVHVMTAGPLEKDIFELFKHADQSGELAIRARVYTPSQHWQAVMDDIDNYRYKSEFLLWGGFKGLTDGALGSSTAWFYEPYLTNQSNVGFPLITAEELRPLIAAANDADVQLALHAIGDRAIDEVIRELVEANPEQLVKRRARIEHFQHPSADAIRRIGELGIIASAHPYHAIDDGRWAESRIGAARIKTTYAFKSILDADGLLSFGSDWPVAPLDPLLGIYAASARQTIDGKNPEGWQPQEKISTESALRAYTVTNAYVGFDERRTGRLKSGLLADFVVLSDNLLSIAPAEIPNIKVLQTFVGGSRVYLATD